MKDRETSLKAAWAEAVQNGALTLSLKTERRRDLFHVARTLILALEGPALDDPQNPVVIAMEGTVAGGKTVFRDMCVRLLLCGRPRDCAVRGFKGSEEYWQHDVNGKPRQITFTNARLIRAPLNEVFVQRTHGGIDLVSNAEDENKKMPINVGMRIDLFTDMTHVGGSKSRKRMDIRITDPRLLQSPAFRAACENLLENQKKHGFCKAQGLRSLICPGPMRNIKFK